MLAQLKLSCNYNTYLLNAYSLITTETGGIMITPRPSPDNSTPKPGFPMRPFFGIDPVLVDDKVHIFSYM